MMNLILKIRSTAIVIVTTTYVFPIAAQPDAKTAEYSTKPLSETALAEGRELAQAIEPVPIEARFRNPWPREWEQAYQERVARVLALWKGKEPKGGTYGENEKNFYPTAMFAFLTGNQERALKAFQEADNQVQDHAHTRGVDYYWSFTLKGQMRKYFYFGKHLDPNYKQRMFESAKIWTEQDPLRRPHPVYGKGDPTKGMWGPENKGSWADVRNTDNLRAMRDTSVYLMAEETGNKATQQLYKEKIKNYVVTLYNIGMSEWDSPNYHSHALSTYHNLYDFAKDPEVKALGKAALDWMYAVGAFKYWRGGFGGPNARDYGGEVVFEQNTVHPFWLYIGDSPLPDPAPDRDAVYHITSSYRPPQAVVALARKQFPRPVEVLATHPPYRDWKPGQETTPEFWETQFFGNAYQLGTLVSPGYGGGKGEWNINAFKMLAYNTARGVDYFVVNTDSVLGHSFKRPGDQIGQYRNLTIWLRPAQPAQPFIFQVPRTAKTENADGIWFFQLEKTWLAVRPINLENYAEMSQAEAFPTAKDKEQIERYRGERFLKAASRGTSYAGFALEVGEEETHGSYEDFKRAVRTKSKLDLAALAQGTVGLIGSNGETLKVTHNGKNELPTVVRNGASVEWDKQLAPYYPVTGSQPIHQNWKSGTLRVTAGNRVFTSSVTPDGKASFSETAATSR